jgi:hypothetical protein
MGTLGADSSGESQHGLAMLVSTAEYAKAGPLIPV